MDNSIVTEKDKEETDNVKKDIQNLTERLSKLKNQSITNLTEQINKLSSTISDLKEKGIEMSRDNIAVLYTITRKNPLKMLISAFILGIIVSVLTKKRN